MPFFLWSKTPASNATADPTIGWAEGQAPSSVNDSARAMMARLKEWGDDNAGNTTLITGGTSSAYTVSSFQVFSSLSNMDQCTIVILPHAVNADNATINVDGLGAKAIQTSPGVGVAAGTMINGVPYRMTYYNSLNAWRLHNFYGNTLVVPVGGCVDYFGSSSPNSNFAFPYGQAISRTTYSVLFALVGTTYGGGDGSTTFNLPDLRGKVTAALDNMGGSAAGITGGSIGTVSTDNGTLDGSALGSRGGNSTHVLTQSQLPNVSPTFTGTAFNVGSSISGSYKAARSAGNFNFSAGASPGWDFNQGDNMNSIFSNITPAGSISALGSGTLVALQPPTFMVNKIMRII